MTKVLLSILHYPITKVFIVIAISGISHMGNLWHYILVNNQSIENTGVAIFKGTNERN